MSTDSNLNPTYRIPLAVLKQKLQILALFTPEDRLKRYHCDRVDDLVATNLPGNFLLIMSKAVHEQSVDYARYFATASIPAANLQSVALDPVAGDYYLTLSDALRPARFGTVFYLTPEDRNRIIHHQPLTTTITGMFGETIIFFSRDYMLQQTVGEPDCDDFGTLFVDLLPRPAGTYVAAHRYTTPEGDYRAPTPDEFNKLFGGLCASGVKYTLDPDGTERRLAIFTKTLKGQVDIRAKLFAESPYFPQTADDFFVSEFVINDETHTIIPVGDPRPFHPEEWQDRPDFHA